MSESDYADDGGLIDTRKCAFAHTIGPNKDGHTHTSGEGKGKGLDICYSATYMSQTRDQQRFTISEAAVDWHVPVVLQRIMWPSVGRADEQLDPRCS